MSSVSRRSVRPERNHASHHVSNHREHPGSPPPVIAVVVLVPVLVALALWAFAWPAARIAPRDLPLGVAGPGRRGHRRLERQLSAARGRLRDPPLRRRGRRPGGRSRTGPYTVPSSSTRPGPEAAHRLGREPRRRPAPPAGGDRTGGADRWIAAPRSATVDVVPAAANDPRGAAFGCERAAAGARRCGRRRRGHPARSARGAGGRPRWSPPPRWSGSPPPRSPTAGSACSPATGGRRPATLGLTALAVSGAVAGTGRAAGHRRVSASAA